jgi:NtrC-family two-component system response regulator AlgB
MEALRGYGWPGNVRELRNVIERASILCRSEVVGVEHLMLAAPARSQNAQLGVGEMVPLEKIEEQHIRAVLAATSSIEEAAKVLEMDTVTLWRRRKKYGI